MFFGGIEGGSTKSSGIIINENGELLTEAVGEPTNHWQIGLEECLRRIHSIVSEMKSKLGLSSETPLDSLGLSLSGCDNQESIELIENGLKKCYPFDSKVIDVSCDTAGGIAAASPHGGVTLISGTGSNCEVMTKSGEFYRCGGWGHVIGDEGSAYWISMFCLKTLFDADDKMKSCDHDLTCVRKLMCQYFNVKDRMGMLEHFYTNFQKAKIAGFCKELANAALLYKDSLCVEAFLLAGRLLARHILSVSHNFDEDFFNQAGGVHIICSGSVWKSLNLLKDGFLDELRSQNSSAENKITEFTLLKLEKPGSFGAAYMGIRKSKLSASIDYSLNTSVLLHHKF